MLKLCAMKKAVAFFNVLRFGRVRMDVGNLFQTRVGLSPFLRIIFDQSLQTGKLPDDWVEANDAPVFKKGDRHSTANYRPISLTCVCAQLLEHIICKQIMSHFSKNKILTPVQHGFRSKHSCESHLLITTDEFIQNFEGKT